MRGVLTKKASIDAELARLNRLRSHAPKRNIISVRDESVSVTLRRQVVRFRFVFNVDGASFFAERPRD